MEIESREKQKLLDSISQDAKNRLDAAEALIMMSEKIFLFNKAESEDNEIIEEKIDEDPASSAEYEFKEVYREPEGQQRKYSFTEKRILVAPYYKA